MAVSKVKATKKRSPRSKLSSNNSASEALALELTDSEKFEKTNNLDYVSDCMYKYGTHTLENRAVPDFRDGLIPVQRRILFGMYKQRNSSRVKSARVVGEVLGKYHPHGDSACYDAMITLVQAPVKFIAGSGNWGSYDDPKSSAAMRYTECQLSDLAERIFFSGYLTRAYDLIANFDNSEKEPVILHSNLPVTLVLGKISGIAVGLACNIPSFTLESVIELTRIALLGKKKITPTLCMNTLEFNFAWGGQVDPKQVQDGTVLKLFKTGVARMSFLPNYSVDEANNELRITGIPPSLRYDTAVTKTIEKGFKISDGTTVDSGGIDIRIDLRNPNFQKRATKTGGVNKEALAEAIKIWTGGTIPFRIATTKRNLTEEALDEGSSALDIDIRANKGVHEIINEWVEYRLDLEVQMAKLELDDLQSAVVKQNLIILARENFDLLKKALDTDEPKETFVKALARKKIKISQEDSAYIFSLTLIRLSKVDIDKTQEKIVELNKQIKLCKKRISNPAPSAIQALDSILAPKTNQEEEDDE